MTDQTARLLRDAENYLSALHGSVARHDNLAANFGCAGCELRDKLAAELRAVSSAGPAPAPDRDTLERVARRLAARDWCIDEEGDDDWERRGEKFRADYLEWAREVLTVLPAPDQQAAEERRLALSQALDLGTGAPWDAIHERVDELAKLAADVERWQRKYNAEHARHVAVVGALVTDRAAVLLEAEAALRAQAKHLTGEFNDSDVLHEDAPAATVATWKRAADLLRRLAGEAQQDECGRPASMASTPCSAGEWCCTGARVAQQDPTQDGAEAHPPQHAWRVETRDPLANEWAPGSHFASRPHAVERYETAHRTAPLWRDGTPVERRIVRETTTYTVEQPAVAARPGQPETDAVRQDGDQ